MTLVEDAMGGVVRLCTASWSVAFEMCGFWGCEVCSAVMHGGVY